MTIAQALLDVLEEPYVHTGIDQFLGNRSKHLLVISDGRQPPRHCITCLSG